MLPVFGSNTQDPSRGTNTTKSLLASDIRNPAVRRWGTAASCSSPPRPWDMVWGAVVLHLQTHDSSLWKVWEPVPWSPRAVKPKESSVQTFSFLGPI